MRSHLRSPDEMNWSNTHLRAVGEVAELRLPQGQRVRLGQRIAVLEAEHRLLRQHRVDHLVARPAFGEVVERRVAVLVLLVDQHRVALRERAALGVLAGQPHRMAFEQQRAERQRLGGRPVDALARSRSPWRALSRKRWMVRWTWKPCGTAVIFSPMSFSVCDRDAGVAAARIVAHRRPASCRTSGRRASRPCWRL